MKVMKVIKKSSIFLSGHESHEFLAKLLINNLFFFDNK